jgi:hypothetical protein
MYFNKYELSFFTEYYQFYILDSASPAKTDADDFWNAEANKRRLAIGVGILGITVAKYAEIQVEIRVLTEKSTEYRDADHIVEASLQLPSGILKVQNCSSFETQLEIPLDKGVYRIRVSSFKIKNVVNDIGDDFYIIDIWKSRFSKPKILKDFEN